MSLYLYPKPNRVEQNGSEKPSCEVHVFFLANVTSPRAPVAPGSLRWDWVPGCTNRSHRTRRNDRSPNVGGANQLSKSWSVFDRNVLLEALAR